jgi:hypothetical protein
MLRAKRQRPCHCSAERNVSQRLMAVGTRSAHRTIFNPKMRAQAYYDRGGYQYLNDR